MLTFILNPSANLFLPTRFLCLSLLCFSSGSTFKTSLILVTINMIWSDLGEKGRKDKSRNFSSNLSEGDSYSNQNMILSINNNCYHLYRAYYFPGAILSIIYINWINLLTALQSNIHYNTLPLKWETKTQNLSCPKSYN